MPTWGRGGAGNIVSPEQVKEIEQKIEDLEANRPLASSSIPPALSPTSPTSTAPPTDYAHMGRGGAGNWYQPTELEKKGSFAQPADSTAMPTSQKPQISTPWHPDTQEMPVGRAGRGGAGNFVWKDAEKERLKREEEEKRIERVREGVEKDVEMGLQKPGAARLGKGEGEDWESWRVMN
ncbi:hypothetical protein P154DRAFT_619105 [Amniculicola lignicola CBS 123094]|uniref:Uncharacterized protein n=1 Tax=Amniculicola lignicola CBS 123094 TaxID=1392246 RepID=A0A6A5WVU4_9PLEO|nr:hypothetical protein P154DRAFT_619105 [Amniculicola lignicola CBS 123094]